MTGIIPDCPTIKKAPCYVPCAHIERITKDYSEYASRVGVIQVMVQAQLQLQEDFKRELCEAVPTLKPAAQLSGMACTEVFDDGCSDVCGEQKRFYSAVDCTSIDCDFDESFYQSVILARRLNKAPTGESLREVAAIFGWSITYTDSGIVLDIGGDDPYKALSVQHFFKKPIGVNLSIVGDC